MTQFRELSKTDRCDRCGAEAYILAMKGDELEYRELLFCGHHGHKHMDALVEQGWATADYTNKLQENNGAVLLRP